MLKDHDRLKAVQRFVNLDIDRNSELQKLVEQAVDIYQTPLAFVTLIGYNRQFILIKAGDDAHANVNKDHLCKVVIESNEALIIPDLLDNNLFEPTNTTHGSPIRFYAGVPLTTHDGYNLGTFCLIDFKPRILGTVEQKTLNLFSMRVTELMEFDISIKLLKDQLQKSKEDENKLRSFFNSPGIYQALIGTSLNLLTYNKQLAEFMSRVFQTELTEGIKIDHVLAGNAIHHFVTDYYKALAGNVAVHERALKHSGSIIWWHVTFAPAYGADKEIIGVSCSASDITERKRTERKVRAQHETLKTIAYIQSHELRKPVASILGFMEIFKSANYRSTKQDLNMMEKAVIDLDKKIRLIVEFSDGL